MSLRNLLWFYWRRARARAKHEELLALAGIAVGVALLYAVQVSNTSLGASVAQLTDDLVGDAQLEVTARGPHGLSAALVPRIERIEAVRFAAPVLEVQANLAGRDGRERSVTLLAADARLQGLDASLVRGVTGRLLTNLRALMLPAEVAGALGVERGGSIELQSSGRSASVPIASVVGAEQVGALSSSPIAVTSLALAQRLTGREGRVSRVYVVAEPGRVDRVRAALEDLAGADVRPVGFDREVYDQLAMPNDSSSSLFAGISALVGFLFAFNAMLVMARERLGLIAELRMSGFGTMTILQVVVFDALVLGVAASALGVVLGDLLSRSVFEPDPGYLAIAFPIGTGRVVEPLTVLLAVGSGVLAAVAAALVPLIRVYRGRLPMDAVHDVGLDREVRRSDRRWWALTGAVGALLVTTIVLVLAPAAALAGMVTLVVAMLLCVPPALAALLALVDRVRHRVTSVVPVITTGELVNASTRSVAIATTAAIAVFGTTAIDGARRDLQRGLDPSARELGGAADVWVSPRGTANLLATSPFDGRTIAAALARLPEVRSVGMYRGSFLDVGDRRTWAIAPPRDARWLFPPSQLVEGNPVQATARLRQGGWAVVSEAVARTLDAEVGRLFRLASPRPATFRLAAITTNLGWSPGVLIVNGDDYRSAWASSDATALQLQLSPGTSPAAGARAVEAALGANAPFVVQTAAEREQSFRATTRAGLTRLQQIAILLITAAALAIAAATSAIMWPRRSRLAHLKLAGIRTRSLWNALVLESALLLSTGAALGAAFGLYGQQLLDRALNAVTGFAVAHTLGLTGALASLALVTVVALLVAAVPGYLAARVPASAAFDE